MTGVSVVVPTCNRPEQLHECLQALAQQTGSEALKVLVVNDSASPTSFPEWPQGLDVTLLASGGLGPAAARNLGWRHTTDSVVAFLDDDVIPLPGWLDAVRSGFGPGVVAIEGPIATDDVDPTRAILVETAPGVGATCNIAYRHSVLEQLCGFDERLRHSEDVDLAHRAKMLGQLRWTPELAIYHPPRQAGLADFSRFARAKGRAHWIFFEKHPDLQPVRSLRWAPLYALLRKWNLRIRTDSRYRASGGRILRAAAILVVEALGVSWLALTEWKRFRREVRE
jgi:GT2 family glycosyltransferase